MSFEKVQKQSSRGKVTFSINGARAIGHPQAKKKKK